MLMHCSCTRRHRGVFWDSNLYNSCLLVWSNSCQGACESLARDAVSRHFIRSTVEFGYRLPYKAKHRSRVKKRIKIETEQYEECKSCDHIMNTTILRMSETPFKDEALTAAGQSSDTPSVTVHDRVSCYFCFLASEAVVYLQTTV